MRFDKLKIIIGVAIVLFVFVASVIIVSGLIIDKAQKQTSQGIDNVAAIINNKTNNNIVSNIADNTTVINTSVATTPAVDNTSTTSVVDNTPQPVVTPPPAPIVNPPTRRTRAS